MDNTFKSPVILATCVGSGGLERGLEIALAALWGNGDTNREGGQGNGGDNNGGYRGVTVAAYVDIEAFVCLNLVKQMEQGLVDPAPVWTDLKTFPAEKFHGKIHGILGGYPCQPFSVAGKGLGEEDPRHLWPYYNTKLIPAIRPVFCFFENVANHLNVGYETVKSDLEAHGYTVKEGIFSAEEVGAPHRRERLFILAMDHSRCVGLESLNQIRPRRNSTEYAGEAVGDTESGQNNGRGFGKLDEKEGIGRCSNNAADFTGETVAETRSKRGQLQAEGEQSTIEQFRWPAPQGSYQHPWEEPRTVEPGLGCTVNGYNFRTDLLRMYGNAVVQWQAAYAFLILIDKHINEYRKTNALECQADN